jgi:putative glutamine amidotransferase
METMSDRPLIAIAPANRAADYVASIERAGGEPWLLDRARDTPADVLGKAAGVLLLGGDDVDPARYGESAHPATRHAEDGRDEYEIALVRGAVDRDVPLLAICRGLQVMNVALGGTLIQDIPSQHPSEVPHAVDPSVKATRPPEEWKARVAHTIAVTPGSKLESLLADERYVNSRHHQAIKQPADSLVISATAPDGVIEAVERPSSTFVLGVQWHPENFVGDTAPHEGGRFLSLFKALVDSATRK